jgi:hypothetical protein
MGHFTGLLGRWNYPQGRGTRPVGEGVKVGGEGAETAHGLGIAPWRHGDPVLGFADVDARGMGMADLECIGEHG